MSIGRLAPSKNRLLASLPPEQYRRLVACLEPVEMRVGETMHRSGPQANANVVFPCSGVVSLNYEMSDGASLAIALVGSEGVIGISQFMDGAVPSCHCTVQTPGRGYRLSSGALRRELGKGGQLHTLGLRFIQALITQMAQTAVCNRHHNLDQQTCRWLLLSLDRLEGNELWMTQEMIAQLLGVRREGVTSAAGRLQDAGIITYSRGRICVLDRQALEERVCECYRVVSDEYHRLLPQPARQHLQVVHD